MKNYILLSFLFVLSFQLKAQTLQQSMMALRFEDHTKVDIVDSTVVFHDHTGELKDIKDYNYFALELAEGLYKQMSDQVFNAYFNAIFVENMTYQNIIKSEDGTVITMSASPTNISVKITKYPEGIVADESFDI